MIQLQLLEEEDVVLPHQYCRPLVPTGIHEVNRISVYGGKPVNHLKWLKVEEVLSERWWGKTLGEIRDTSTLGGNSIFPYEVVEVVKDRMPRGHVYGT